MNRLEDWKSFASDTLPAVPQFERQVGGDEEVRAAPEQEQLRQGLVDRPDKRRKQQSARTEIPGDNPRERRDWLRSQCPPGFYVCESNKRKFRVLHLLGACYNVPGVDHFVFEHKGLDMPNESAYDSICTLQSQRSRRTGCRLRSLAGLILD